MEFSFLKLTLGIPRELSRQARPVDRFFFVTAPLPDTHCAGDTLRLRCEEMYPTWFGPWLIQVAATVISKLIGSYEWSSGSKTNIPTTATFIWYDGHDTVNTSSSVSLFSLESRGSVYA